MPDVYTSTSTVPNLVTAAYDRYLRLALRTIPQFRSFADTKPTQQTHPGSSVIFSFYSDLAEATSAIDEVTDPSAVQIPDPTRVTVTLGEYGNYAVLTKRLQEFSLDAAIDTNAADMIAYNLATSVDTLVQTELATSAQFIRESGGSLSTAAAVNTVTGTDTAKARDFRYAVTKLRAGMVVPTRGEHYAAVVHPSVAHDLRIESGSTGWRTPHEYVDTSNIYAAEIGTFEGCAYVESPRCIKANVGAASATVYNSYVMGKEALAEALAIEPHMVIGGPITDPLQRKSAMGWHGILGWKLFRPTAMWKVQTAATVN